MSEAINNEIGFSFFCVNKPFDFLDENNLNENDDFRYKLGDIIRNCRKKLHMTQQQLANKAEVCRHTIGNIEWGSNDNTPQFIKKKPSYWKIATALNKPLEDLFAEALYDTVNK